MVLYNINSYKTPEEFLRLFAKRFGLLGKKGVVDIFKAARVLVQDWNRYEEIKKNIYSVIFFFPMKIIN